MKFGKNLLEVIEFSNPEWGPYWLNYKLLKKKIGEIENEKRSVVIIVKENADPSEITKSYAEIEFFKLLKAEVKRTNDFFLTEEGLFKIRRSRVLEAYRMLKESGPRFDKSTWTRLSTACVKFYEDVLHLENFAIMNYCGFSKILKKHDKLTGFSTREAFMKKILDQQCFSHHEILLHMLQESEQLFDNIQRLRCTLPLKEEEQLFIDAIRDLNSQASRMQVMVNETLRDEDDEKPEFTQAETLLTASALLFPLSHCVGRPFTSRQLTYAEITSDDELRRSYQLTSKVTNSGSNLTSAISWINKVSDAATKDVSMPDITEDSSNEVKFECSSTTNQPDSKRLKI